MTLFGVTILVAIPAGAHAASVSPSAPVASDGAAAGMVFAIAILALLVVTGVAVKLHDRKRKLEDEVAALQGRISDAFFADRALSSMTITPTVTMPFRRGGLVTVTINGTVPTPETRDAAIQLAMKAMEESQVSFRLEDRIAVDPMMSRHAA
jgi:hypothetical protein